MVNEPLYPVSSQINCLQGQSFVCLFVSQDLKYFLLLGSSSLGQLFNTATLEGAREGGPEVGVAGDRL